MTDIEDFRGIQAVFREPETVPPVLDDGTITTLPGPAATPSEPPVATTEEGAALMAWAQSDMRPLQEFGYDSVEEAVVAIEAAARSVPEDPAGLGAAWREAEATLPKGYRLALSYPLKIGDGPPENLYHATARRETDYLGYVGHNPGGPTPAAALRALVDALRSDS